ncbi:hypothetical protein Bbelb_166460 [Branchiostoma belcheri]|nr:hypothetical protein Bbelb_166460 [Branchiostoma belcheri]
MFRVGLLGLVFTAGRSRFARRHHRMEGQDECGETYNFGSRRVLRPPIDPWGATIIEAENWAGFYCYFCSEERNTSISGPKFWKAQSSALPRPSLGTIRIFATQRSKKSRALRSENPDGTQASHDPLFALGYFMRCQGNGTNTGATPVGAYRLDPPTGLAPSPTGKYRTVPNNVLILDNVAHLDEMPPSGPTVYAIPIKDKDRRRKRSSLSSFRNRGWPNQRSRADNAKPGPRLECGKRTFAYRGAVGWNKLPPGVRTAPSIQTFRTLAVSPLCRLREAVKLNFRRSEMDQGWSQDELRQIGEQRESWCTVDSNALRIWCRPERKHAQQAFRSDVFSQARGVPLGGWGSERRSRLSRAGRQPGPERLNIHGSHIYRAGPNRNEQTEPRCTFQVNAPTHRERRHYPEKPNPGTPEKEATGYKTASKGNPAENLERLDDVSSQHWRHGRCNNWSCSDQEPVDNN